MTDLLDTALNDLVPAFADEQPDWMDVVARSGRQPQRPSLVWRRHPRRAVAIAFALVLVALLATPAFGVQGYLLQLIGRKNVSFVKSAPAPNIVKKFFFDLPIGDPGASRLGVKAGQAREVATFSIAGHPRKLWVVPTKNGGYCFMFELDFGSCRGPSSTTAVPLGVSWEGGPPSRGVNASIVTRVGGDVTPPTTARITAHYADGTSTDIPFVWVSRPIAAGFFTYDIPVAHWSARHRLLTITLSTKGGRQLARQTFAYQAHPIPVRRAAVPAQGASGPRALPTSPFVLPTPPTQTATADGYRVVVGHNGSVQFTKVGQTPILAELAGRSVIYDCFRLTREFGIFTVRGAGVDGALAPTVGLALSGVGTPVDGCDVEAPIGHTWPDRLRNHAAAEIPLTAAGRAYFADRAAARDLGLFVRSRRMHQLRREPAPQAKADILRAYGKLLAQSPIGIEVIDPSTLRFTERSTTGKTFSVTVHAGRIKEQNLKPYGLVF
jgi:hypothetical protein